MIYGREIAFSTPPNGLLAGFIMSSEDNNDKGSMKKDWDPGGKSTGPKPVLFKPEEMDIYCNKVTGDYYIFHGKEIDYDLIDRLEYDHKTYTVDVILKNGGRLDLGVKIQWLVRPYFSKANEVHIAQTKDGKSINGTIVPLVHKQKK